MTPNRTLSLEGYGNRDATPIGTRDHLQVKAIAFDDRTTPVAVISPEKYGIKPATVGHIRSVIEANSGTPGDSVVAT